MEHFNEIYREARVNGTLFLETYSLNKGLKKFGEEGKKAAMKEMQQLHDRVCFEPIKLESLSPTEKKESIGIFNLPGGEEVGRNQGKNLRQRQSTEELDDQGRFDKSYGIDPSIIFNSCDRSTQREGYSNMRQPECVYTNRPTRI